MGRLLPTARAMLRLATALLLLATPGVAAAADWVPTSTATKLSLGPYVAAYHQVTNRLRIQEIAVQSAEVEVQRRRDRATMEIEASPTVGMHGYSYTSGAGAAVGDFGGEIGWSRGGNWGERYGVRAHVSAPTQAGHLGRVATYGVTGQYRMPLLRNFLGREFDLSAKVFEQAKVQAQPGLRASELLVCFDAIARYVRRYTAQERLRVHLALRDEKRRIWRQTVSDFRRRMITRLDMLAAKADWLAFSAETPRFYSALESSDAALVAFVDKPWRRMPVLVEPQLPWDRLDDGPTLVADMDWSKHPRTAAFVAAQGGLRAQLDLLVERNGHELAVEATAGVDRAHDVFDPTGRGAVITDVHALVGVHWLWPLERPSVAYERRLLELRLDEISQRVAQLERLLSTAVTTSAARYRREVEALKAIETQLEAATRQAKAAYQEFRNGKLEFQNYLDHWGPYQAARLAYWDRRESQYLATLDILEAIDSRPKVCELAVR